MIHGDEIIWMAFALCPNKFYVKIHLKTSSKTARTKTWLEKGTYWIRKYTSFSYQRSWFFFYLQFQSLF